MAKFIYKAKKGPKEIIEGTFQVDNAQVVIHRLIELGYHPISVREEKKSADFSRRFLHRITSQNIANFTRSLSELLSSGLPLSKSLSTLQDETPNFGLKEVIENLKNRVEKGETFAHSLENYPRLFSPLYTHMVHSGEVSGTLQEVLSRLADFSEKEEEIKQKIKSALTYPFLLSGVAFLTIFVLLTFVIPKFVTIFQEWGQTLPLPTLLLISFSGFLQHFWWLVFVLLFLLLAIGKRFAHTSGAKLFFDRFKLNSPLFGPLIRKREISRFLRTIGTLLENGIPLLSTLEVSKGIFTNRVLYREAESIYRDVKKGESLSSSLKRSQYFPSSVTNLIGVGEKTGKLGDSFLKTGNILGRETDRTTKTLTTLLEPVMIIFWGGIVGFIVIAMLLPVFSISTIIK